METTATFAKCRHRTNPLQPPVSAVVGWNRFRWSITMKQRVLGIKRRILFINLSKNIDSALTIRASKRRHSVSVAGAPTNVIGLK